MKFSKHLLFILLFATSKLISQNIFPQKLDSCHFEQFCLDCGEPRANFDISSFEKVLQTLNAKYNFKGGKGRIGFQVVVDSTDKGCVLSHTDPTTNRLTKDIIQLLNSCQWIAALDKDKKVNSSINVDFLVANDKISGRILRVDHESLNENMNNPGTPEIYNKSYKYNNSHLKDYEITVWQKSNSNLPNDMSTTSTIDKEDIVWYATYNGFTKFDGKQFIRFNESNSPFSKKESLHAIAVDNENNKWFYTGGGVHKFDNKNWTKYDSSATKIDGIFNIVTTQNNEILFCSRQGLLVHKNEKWNLYNKSKIKQLPSNMVLYAYKDKKQRLWIGTYEGSIMIDSNDKVTEFNNSDTPLNKICISGVSEDEKGNLYFSLYAYEKSKNRNRPEEGIAIFSSTGKWSHFNDTNSGLPSNTINSILYDKFEKILWVGTNESGLVRYDLKENWENYHNQNSKVPSSYIFDLSQDSKGNIYVSTFNGMMKIRKK
jgi:hypothetical protein